MGKWESGTHLFSPLGQLLLQLQIKQKWYPNFKATEYMYSTKICFISLCISEECNHFTESLMARKIRLEMSNVMMPRNVNTLLFDLENTELQS